MNDLNSLHSKSRPFLRRIVLFFFIFVPIILLIASLSLEIAVNRSALPKSLFEDLNGTPVLLDREGKIIAQISSDKARVHVPIPMNKMGKHLPKVTIALEDHRYKAHKGIDFYAIFAATYRTLTHTDHLSGASTISQQTLKLASKRKDRSLNSKIKEALSALKLERIWNKEQILESYMNRLDYGNRRLGPEAAAWSYFGKSASSLTLTESIFIAGLPHSPTKYNPWLRPENANSKYLRSIKRLQLLGILTAAQSERLANNPPVAHRKLPPTSAPAFVEAMLRNTKSFSKSDPVLTTLDSSIQKSADDILVKRLNLLNRHSIRNAGMVVIENATGYVRAISSISTKDGSSERSYNAPLVWRQAGSTLKPFVYLLGIEERKFTVSSLLPDTADSIPNKFRAYEPKNFNHKFNGPVRVRNALASSLNVPAVYALSLTGPRKSFDFTTQFGIKTSESIDDLGAGFVLGNRKIRLLDLASAYSNIARTGLVIPPIFAENTALRPKRIVSEESVEIITDILADNEARSASFGRHSSLHITDHRTAVKTGTSSSYRDAWTVGYDKDHTVAVWFGNLNGRTMNGSLTIESAAPAWKEMFIFLAKSKESKPLNKTTKTRINIDALTGLLPCKHTKYLIEEIFLSGTKPSKDSTEFYDSNGNILLSDEYAGWCATKDNYLSASVRPSLNGGPRILSPNDGASFRIDPEIPADQQRITLSSDADQTRWNVNGKPLTDPYLTLSPGNYLIRASTKSGSSTARITVR